MARSKSPWPSLRATVVSLLGSGRLPLLSLSLILVVVVYFQIVAVSRLGPKVQPFEGFGTLGEKEAQRVVQEKKTEARKLPSSIGCPDSPRDVPADVIFSARQWLKPWSSDIQDHPEKRFTERTMDEFFAWLEQQGFGVARIRVTNGMLSKPVMVKGREREDSTYLQRVARWYLLFDTLQRTRGLPSYLDLVVSTAITPLLPLSVPSLSRPPLFGYFAHEGFLDVPLPSFELYGRLRKWRKNVVLAHPWISRNPKVFWRGPPEGSGKGGEKEHWKNHPSAAMVRLGRKIPEAVDARFEDCRPVGCSEELWRKVYRNELTTETNVSYSDYLRHRFVVATDTSSLESRFSYLLSTMAVVLKPKSLTKEYFEEFLVPFVHFVPLEAQGGDWEERIKELQANVVRVSEISREATIAFEEHVVNDKWLDYAWALVSAYALLQQTEQD
ncbi:hypothetical protein KFL_007130050 [Klebsormidium nitens]|uniref:Glycosyl transferase CAP10 domain-containing protein n=1 Tax=Klebsormidium nitens TaxID=105231 RepID=A0A1Y1IQI5_KLENI|nr:hypothetical protein KFL_007130050 [Klebsormidium nitens]|eukprot:GAQ91016.1 hypothetical protein KFL_007130050 [Klebsormidium nitens]